MEKLIKLADSLDQRGLKAEADMLDGILQEVGKTVSAAEEAAAEEKKERETSKKVMKLFKRLHEAAEKASDGNVDTRGPYRDWETDRKSTRLNSSHSGESRMPSSA